jgi:hypothetical protein
MLRVPPDGDNEGEELVHCGAFARARPDPAEIRGGGWYEDLT